MQSLLQRTLQLREAAVGRDHPWIADTLMVQAQLWARQGQPQRAASVLKRALAIRTKKLGPDHPAAQEAARALADMQREPSGRGLLDR